MKVTTKKFGEDVSKTRAKNKATNERLTEQARKNKAANVKSAAAEAKAASPRKVVSDTSRTASTLASTFGGLAGNAARAIRSRKGQGD